MSLELFLVEAQVVQSEYMCSNAIIDDLRLVKAKDKKAAEALYLKYWEAQSDTYGTSYYVDYLEVKETIREGGNE